MKKLLTLSFLLVVSGVVTAQNIQLHYDFGRNIYKELKKSSDTYGRPALTTTIEMFRPDSFGSTYFFVDVDYAPGVKGHIWRLLVSSASGRRTVHGSSHRTSSSRSTNYGSI